MEDKVELIESLLEKAAEYGKTSFELVKLKAIDKTSDLVSSVIPKWIVFILFALCMLFLNIGIAVWLGEILGKIYFGFFVVAAFYGITGTIIHFFMNETLKKMVRNNFIKHILK
jgi:hypothetical protein